MIFLFINNHKIKTLSLKKTLLGQEEVSFFEKKYDSQLLEKGLPINDDLLASAIKEVITLTKITDKSVFLILPQELFYYFRTEVPVDIAPSALNSFIKDKARTHLPVMVDDLIGDFFIKENNHQKVINFYSLNKEAFERYKKILSLLDLSIINLVPETILYFKLFEKTLRAEKKETIIYLHIEKNFLYGYLYDNFGLIKDEKIFSDFKENQSLEEIIKKQVKILKDKGEKINRIILSGEASENIRQDTFTKEVGVWTNLLKRIIPNFYNQYIKMLVLEKNKTFPVLNLDICLGGFIFNKEEKFSLSRINNTHLSKKQFNFKKIFLNKEIFLFISSFAFSFIVFILVSQLKLTNLFGYKKNRQTTIIPSITIIPSPIPTLSFKKEELKIEILNGSGIPGKASELRKILKEKNYKEIITGNADNFNYKKTKIKVKKDKIDATQMLKNDLKDYFSSFDEEILDKKETADIVITLGTDFK